jgi:hypothetical protein
MTDVTGGRDPELDLALSEAPKDPEFREGVNIWLFDDTGQFALPRFGVEAIGSRWASRGFQATVAFRDGRVLVGGAEGAALDPLDDAGEPTVFGAGPVRFQCLEPFRSWSLVYRGEAVETTVADQLAGTSGDRRVEVEVDVAMVMAVPPWIRGEMSDTARATLAGTDEAQFIGGVGGLNCKQLFRARGRLRVGSEESEFTATGLRVHRKGVRHTQDFRGHCWQSALFPSGRAFEALSFPDHTDGTPSYNEGFVFDGEHIHPAQVTASPWMTTFQPHGGDVSLSLDSDQGPTDIAGVTSVSTVMPGRAATESTAMMRGGGSVHDLFFHQGGAKYTWDGEVGYGMVERSLPSYQVTVRR